MPWTVTEAEAAERKRRADWGNLMKEIAEIERRRNHFYSLQLRSHRRDLSRVKLPPGPRGAWLTFGPGSAL